MPCSQNLATAVAVVENTFRKNGVLPATITISNRKINVGKFFINTVLGRNIFS
jgi:pseudouridine-5'-phosphate glycosidase